MKKDDPYYIHSIDNEDVQLPVLFWKVILYTKHDGKLYTAGFLMNQYRLLQSDNLLRKLPLKHATREFGISDDPFQQFSEKKTYQVKVSFIEEISGLTFHNAIDSFVNDQPAALILEETNIDPQKRSYDSLKNDDDYSVDDFEIKNLAL